MNTDIFTEIKELTKVLSGRVDMIKQLISIAEEEKKAVMARNAEQFSSLVDKKEALIQDISSVEAEIKRIHELAALSKGTIPEDIKSGFGVVVKEINDNLTKWATMEQQNMQFAHAFKMSLEKKISQVKKNINVAGAYNQKKTPPKPKGFDAQV